MSSASTDTPIQLGTVRTPSGILVTMDCGLVRLWCHDENPELPDGILASREATATANSAVDIMIRGPDAEACGRAYDRSGHPLFVYDVPESHLPEGLAILRRFAEKHHFDVDFEVIQPRITHLQRARDVLESRPGGAVSFHGIWASVASGLPTDRDLPVLGEVHRGSEFEGLWQRVYVVVSDRPVTRSEAAGWVKVQEGGLMFCDLERLEVWEEDRTLDGRADLVFWGRDAARIAKRISAPSLGENTFGWLGKPMPKATLVGQRLEQLAQRKSFEFEFAFRPHTHHWLAMEQVRNGSASSGILELDGAPTTVFGTTWGDGVWEVCCDLDAAGGLVRVRVELATPATLERMRS